MTVRSTAYCHLENEPGAYGNKNAVGGTLRYGNIRSAAADWSRFPLGTQFKIVGEPYIYEIDDFGSALVGNSTIDFYKPTLAMMNAWGLRYVEIEITKWGSYQASADYLRGRTYYWHTRQMYAELEKKLATSKYYYSGNSNSSTKKSTSYKPVSTKPTTTNIRTSDHSVRRGSTFFKSSN